MPTRYFEQSESAEKISMSKMAGVVTGWIVLWSLLSTFPVFAAENPKTFAYVDSKHLITAEVAGEHTFVVNFINLSDFVVVIQPADFIYKGASGQHYLGQVYELRHEDTFGNLQRYSASILVKGRSFEGLNIVGFFREKEAIEELSMRIGSRRFYLQGLEKSRFEELVRKIEELDLYSNDVPAMFHKLNIQEMGHVESPDGTAEWERDWDGLITEDGISPPIVIEKPPILFPEDASKYKGNEVIRISFIINKNGGILNLKVVKGINRKLDQRALDGVANSWIFLPATKNGEVFESLMEFNVTFANPLGIP